MRDFKRVINDIEFSLADLLLFQIFLNSTIIFLSIFLLTSLINFYPLYASLIPAVVYFIFGVVKKFRMNKVRQVEYRYPELREKLRTAADFSTEHNEIIERLQNEIVAVLKKVKLSSFISIKDVFFKIVLSVLLSFVIIYIASIHGPFYNSARGISNAAQSVNDLIDSIADINKVEDTPEQVLKGLTVDNSTEGGDQEGDSIYGDKSLAQLGTEEIELEIKNSNLEFDITKEGEFDDEDFIEDSFPFEIDPQSAEAFSESISANDRQIVKDYFTRIANG